MTCISIRIWRLFSTAWYIKKIVLHFSFAGTFILSHKRRVLCVELLAGVCSLCSMWVNSIRASRRTWPFLLQKAKSSIILLWYLQVGTDKSASGISNVGSSMAHIFSAYIKAIIRISISCLPAWSLWSKLYILFLYLWEYFWIHDMIWHICNSLQLTTIYKWLQFINGYNIFKFKSDLLFILGKGTQR